MDVLVTFTFSGKGLIQRGKFFWAGRRRDIGKFWKGAPETRIMFGGGGLFGVNVCFASKSGHKLSFP